MRSSAGGASFASVLVRARPPLPTEASYGHCARTEGKKVVLTTETLAPAGDKRTKAIECQYDKVLGIQSGQQEVWETVVPLVNKAFDGYNVTLFTYGMTGSGKTYTMLGPTLMESAFEGTAAPTSSHIGKDNNRGVVVRVMQQIFKQVPEARVSLNYVQVYQERCYDLLQPASTKPLRVREDSQKKPGQNVNVFLEDLTEVVVTNVEECLEYLILGFANVAFRSTNYNEQSSRAHCILTLTVQQQLGDRLRESKLRLVDLAGNERWVMTGPQISPQHARELATINRSMHILGSCLQTLSKPPVYKQGIEVDRHVPYRDSTLTLLLRDSLAGNSYTLMICTICCSVLYQMQTLSTLRFADRVKRVKMKATICDTMDHKEVQNQIQAEVEYLRAAVSGASARGDLQELKQRVSNLQKACLGLEGENRQLREQIAELEKQPLQKGTVKAATRRVRRTNSEPSLPTPDPWFEEEDLQAACYRSHDDMGSRMAGRCPKGHRLQSMGSIAHPHPAAANAAYFEWHCDRPGCRGSSRILDLGRFHCSLCHHDLCQACYDQLVGKSYSRTDVHAHVARRPKAVSAAPKAPEPRDTWDRRTPMNPQQVPKVTPRETPREILEERSERSERSAKVRPPPSVPSAAPTASATSSPSAPSAPSKPRPADPNAAPEKPPYILRLEESARAFARVNRERRRKQGPASARQKVHGGVQSGASIGSASTASTTPESVRKRLLAGSEAGYHGHGGLERNGGTLPPLHSRAPGAYQAHADRARQLDRRKEAEAAGRHPDIPLRDAIFLPALEEDWQLSQPRPSPKKAVPSPQLWGRKRDAIPSPRDETRDEREAPKGSPRGPPKPKPPPVLAPGLGAADAVDMRTILGELDAKHAQNKEGADAAAWQASTWPREFTKPLE